MLTPKQIKNHEFQQAGRNAYKREDVDAFLDEIKESLIDGKTIELRGFGTFEPRLRKGRDIARNPKTGEKVSVEPHYIAAFRAGQSLKENLWNLKTTDEK